MAAVRSLAAGSELVTIAAFAASADNELEVYLRRGLENGLTVSFSMAAQMEADEVVASPA